MVLAAKCTTLDKVINFEETSQQHPFSLWEFIFE